MQVCYQLFQSGVTVSFFMSPLASAGVWSLLHWVVLFAEGVQGAAADEVIGINVVWCCKYSTANTDSDTFNW